MTIYYVHKDHLIPADVSSFNADPTMIAVVTVHEHDAQVERVYQQAVFGEEDTLL